MKIRKKHFLIVRFFGELGLKRMQGMINFLAPQNIFSENSLKNPDKALLIQTKPLIL